jgi:hypothetical protein
LLSRATAVWWLIFRAYKIAPLACCSAFVTKERWKVLNGDSKANREAQTPFIANGPTTAPRDSIRAKKTGAVIAAKKTHQNGTKVE